MVTWIRSVVPIAILAAREGNENGNDGNVLLSPFIREAFQNIDILLDGLLDCRAQLKSHNNLISNTRRSISNAFPDGMYQYADASHHPRRGYVRFWQHFYFPI